MVGAIRNRPGKMVDLHNNEAYIANSSLINGDVECISHLVVTYNIISRIVNDFALVKFKNIVKYTMHHWILMIGIVRSHVILPRYSKMQVIIIFQLS